MTDIDDFKARLAAVAVPTDATAMDDFWLKIEAIKAPDAASQRLLLIRRIQGHVWHLSLDSPADGKRSRNLLLEAHEALEKAADEIETLRKDLLEAQVGLLREGMERDRLRGLDP